MRAAALVCGLLVASAAAAATPKEIDAAVRKGAGALKQQFKDLKPGQVPGSAGAMALAGLALLESGVPADDPAIQTITLQVRNSAFTETQTYPIALCLLYLDRFGEPADVPIIQMLAVRLLAGQNERGGWSYECIESVPAGDERVLRTSLLDAELKSGKFHRPSTESGKIAAAPRLHPVIEKYAGRLKTSRRFRLDDNSNTQFAVLGVWVSRKHGVPVEPALDLIERRFLATQTATGGWPYSGPVQGSPSMTCAGLLGLATGIGRREERRLKADIGVRKDDLFAKSAPRDPPRAGPKNKDPFFDPPTIPKSSDPFFNPGAVPEPPAKKAGGKDPGARKAPVDARDAAVQRGLASLGALMARLAGPGGNRQLLGGGGLGDRDFYFLWSLERVGVLYGLDRIGGIDWYEAGADSLVASQAADGSWGGRGGGGVGVDTSFALLFLARSNLVRDLSNKVQKDASNTELRAGSGPGRTDKETTTPPPKPVAIEPKLPPLAEPASPTGSASTPKDVAAMLTAATDASWIKTLEQVRDAKGAVFTQGLVLAIHRLEEDRRKAARTALAERLTRMTADTLRAMAKETDVELRRGAVLAMAMKDDRAHLPDLITALLDEEDLVVRAARAGLKSASGQDFGPGAGASLADRTAAARAWLEWLKKQK